MASGSLSEAASDLNGKRALVTGAGTRVGAEIARSLGALGMHVAVHYHGSREGADATCASIAAAGGKAFPIAADLRDEQALTQLARAAIAQLGGLDLLVPSAASFEHGYLSQLERAEFDRTLSLNLFAPLLLAREAANALTQARGSIVFVTCISRLAPYRDYLVYQASKAALHQAMRVLALELAPHVRVNAVAPGTVLPPPGMSEQAVAALVKDIPLGRVGSAQAVARAVVQLARSPFVTGTELVVDGGVAARAGD